MTEKPIKYDPLIHHRRNIRLKKYDYSQGGAYFITICCQDKTCRFGQVENNEMILNEYGEAARSEWLKLSVRYPGAIFNVLSSGPTSH